VWLDGDMSPLDLFVEEILSGKYDQEITTLLIHYKNYDSVVDEVIINILEAHSIKNIELSSAQKVNLRTHIYEKLMLQKNLI